MVFSQRTLAMLKYDLVRFRTRMKACFRRRPIQPVFRRLHFGCGPNHIEGWLNVDLTKSDHDVDLSLGRLPWADGVFDAVLSEHTIEHLDLTAEVIPLLREVRRVTSASGELWLSCPDMEKVCGAYFEDRGRKLVMGRAERIPGWTL